MSMYFEEGEDLDDVFEDNLEGELDDAEFAPEEFVAMGIDPNEPTRARPGSEAKVIMLSARYAAGLPLWNDSDCYEHGPKEVDLMGTQVPQR